MSLPRSVAWILLFVVGNCGCECNAGDLVFPVKAELFIDQFRAAEGLTFNGSGDLYLGADSGVWRAKPDGSVRKISDVYTHLGQAGYGSQDILAADFGPTLALNSGPNVDGIIWRVTPDGKRTIGARGIPDPNFILVRPDGSYLVSDDFADAIYVVEVTGKVRLWFDGIQHPNGMVLASDQKTLYVAQIFTGIAPLGFSDRLWALPLVAGEPAGPPKLAFKTGGGGLDGLAMDEKGRIYIADNGQGKIWRFDPATTESVLITENVPAVASLVFGEGDFDHNSIYATSTYKGGGRIWRVPVGISGQPLHRGPSEGSVASPARSGCFDPINAIAIHNTGRFSLQMEFKTAMVALHGFRFEEARHAFRKIQASDPNFALAYLGEALTFFQPLRGEINLTPGRDVLARMHGAGGLSPNLEGTDAEQALTRAVTALFGDGLNSQRIKRFSDILGQAYEHNNLEPEIAALYALSLMSQQRSEARPARNALLRAIVVLEGILDDHHQRHPGATHYLIHAYDMLQMAPLRNRYEKRYEEEIDAALDHGACSR